MIRIAAGFMFAVLLAAGVANAAELHKRSQGSGPVIKIEQGEACVAPVEEMRRNHMKMLLHQRDRTLRQGYREPRSSLKGCVNCHASQETGTVLGKDGFCASCHAYAAVKMDCFECHTPVRQVPAAGASR